MGQGYVRQSAADIINGNRIQAEHFNNEYNQLQAAFDGNSGHSHDGTVGEGQKILLTSAVTGTLPIANGGTGATDVAGVKTNLGLGTMAEQNSGTVSITGGTITGITDLAVADGGTGASTASAARTNLGLGTIATQNSNSVSVTGGSITGITDLAIADGGTGASTASIARTNLGLGTIATQDASSVTITGGTIAGTFTGNITGNVTGNTNGAVTSSSATITGGSITGITDLAVADGGTGSSTASGARTNLGLVIGTDVQAQDAELQAIAGLTSAANKLPYFTGSGTASITDLSAYGRTLIDDADDATARQTLGLNTRVFAASFSGAGPVNITDLGVQGTPKLIECDIWAIPSTVAATIILRYSTNNGSSYYSGAADYGNNFLYTRHTTTTAQSTDSSTNSSAGSFGWFSSIIPKSTSGFGAQAKFSIATRSGYSNSLGTATYYANATSSLYHGIVSSWIGQGPINAIQLSSTQNFEGFYVIKVYY
jgi:hypothetical protein